MHLLDGIAQNHPFEQGNKRTAFTAAVMFLKANGYNLSVRDGSEFGRIISYLVEGSISLEKFTDLIRPLIDPIE